MKTALVAKAGAIAAAGITAFVVNSTPAHAAALDGTDPSGTGCASGAYTARSAYGYLGGVAQVLVELRYSPRCRTTWARVTTLNMPSCVPGQDWCGDATVHRNSDGRAYTCLIPRGGHGCYTAQVNDAGVTSWAFGEADNGALTAMASTGSF